MLLLVYSANKRDEEEDRKSSRGAHDCVNFVLPFYFLSIFCATLQRPRAIEDIMITAPGAAKQQIHITLDLQWPKWNSSQKPLKDP